MVSAGIFKKRGLQVGKRGQVTIFIIISLILLISITLIIYYRNLTLQEPEIVPPQFDPVKSYVSSCVARTGQAAIVYLGQQGGYSDIPEQWILNRDSYLSVDNLGLLNVPYWYYKGDSRVPSLQGMEGSISQYVEENLDSCLMEFQAFDGTFDIDERRKLEVETTINEEDVLIEADYLLKVKSKADSESTYLSDFSAQLDVKLKKAYDLARKIMEKENELLLFENATMDILSMHPDIPLSGMTFRCGEETWYLEDIKDELSSIMKYQVSRIRIKNTDYIAFDADKDEYEYFDKFDAEDILAGQRPSRPLPSDAYDYFHYFWDVGTPKTGLHAAFQYQPHWGMDIQAQPSRGGMLRSKVGEGSRKYLSFMCINFYHFTYDITYPVMAAISDEEAFNNEGFVFRFAFPVLIKNNQGNRVDFGRDIYEPASELIPLCGDTGGPFYDIRVVGTDEDGYANMELKDVNVSYDCYKYSCYLGKTGPNGGTYKLTTQLPAFCAHGNLVAEKPGYYKASKQVLDNQDITIEMKKLRRLNFSVVMHDYQSAPPSFIDENEKQLKDDMTVLINLRHHNITDFQQYRIYPFDSETEQNMKEIELLDEDATYMLDIMLTNERFGLLGGYRANWTVSWQDMQGADNIRFRVINYLPVPYRVDDQYELTMFLDSNKEYRTDLKPVFET